MDSKRQQLLPVALVAFGVVFLLVYPLMVVWPSRWAWQPRQHEYEQMIVGIYATLGVFLLWAARQPEAHLSLSWRHNYMRIRGRPVSACRGVHAARRLGVGGRSI